ncbi:hypothetical protein EW146_g533 [Bondarzewia mesenterica]|uniref:ZNF598/HEL2 PAH domain-containing protein n=1 Tax=Bondarzewia mesenterica TaxID=1095465 RepID=A0A4S4M6H0_9AGAM|nr:hypothetical protein EW146_g533 [Bondarzewia mesenterica]
MVEEHGADMSSRDKKAASRVHAGFEFQEVNGARRRGAREREPPPGPQPPPGTSRTNNSRRDRFGGHLTVEGDVNGSANNSAGPSRRQSPSPPPADMDSATAERYVLLLSRLRVVASNPTNAMAAVKSSLRSFRASESGARDLISTVWNILDRDLDNTASIVNLLVDLIDDDEKKTSLLGAWNGFKIEQRRQFPDLVPTSIGTNYAGITGGRVLSAKSATATRSTRQSSRAVWDRVAKAASSSGTSHVARPTDRFPTLQPSAPPVTAGFRQPQRPTAWSASASGQSVPPPSPPSSSPQPPRPSPPSLSKSLFPELPSSTSSRSKPVISGSNASLQKVLGSAAPATSAWGSSSSVTAATETTGAAQESTGRKKGKGKQKQTLFTLGSFPT